jgi:DNA-binding transcriptional LysR family regulator
MESLQRLRVLRAVALEGSFTRAATTLSMSQPAVSQHIAALERELGANLVDRTSLGVRLTAEGDVALRHALRILKTVDEARREIEHLRSGSHEPVRIAAFPTACTHLLPRATAELQRRHPNAPFVFTEADADRALDLLHEGRVDLAIVYDYAAHPIELRHLVVQHVLDDPLRLVLPSHHPAALSAVVDLDRLAGEPWISGTAYACAESLRAVCGVAGFTPRVALDSNRYPTTLALVAAGHGIALVPESALGHPPHGVVTKPLRPTPPPRRIWAATDKPPTGFVAQLVDCLLERGAGVSAA